LKVLSNRVAPAVVEVRSWRYGKAEEEQSTAGLVVRQQLTGSGVILDANGYIVTNAHVIEDAKTIRVYLNRSREQGSPARSSVVSPAGFLATVVGMDADIDLAVLKIKATGLPTIAVADYDTVRQGEMVIAIGSPMGAHAAITFGVISSVARQLDTGSNAVYIQTDAALNPGNSGGPLVDADGKLVGINTMFMEGNKIGLAIPADVVRHAYEEIRKSGRVRSGDIGVDVQDLTPVIAAGLRLTLDAGIVISDVRNNGPSDKSGLSPEDIILAMDGRVVENTIDFASRVYRKRPGEHVELEVLRQSSRFKVSVPVIERKASPDDIRKSSNPSDRTLIDTLRVYGVDLDKDTAESMPGLRHVKGVLVTRKAVNDDETESTNNLDVGDVIYGLNGSRITRLADLRAAVAKLRAGDPVVLQVERKRRAILVSFELEP
jgi:serine protease Do